MECEPAPLPVILVDDEQDILFSASEVLESHGIGPVETIDRGEALIPLLERAEAGVVVLDLFMPRVAGMELLPVIVARFPRVPVIVMTASERVDTAVQCMKLGAYDFLVKPVEAARFATAVAKALELRSLRLQVELLERSLLEARLHHGDNFAAIVTRSEKMRAIFRYVEAVAPSGEPLTVMGETGVGKELVARAIHAASGRRGEFVAVNVAGVDDILFSDTLFGHTRGAFTGALGHRAGLIAQAAGGSLFLDEIGDLAPASQVKLLRLLQEGTYLALGSDVPRISDVRIIAATNQNLWRKVKDGTFREDLYYRLAVHLLTIPPLRERCEDIPLLLEHFVTEVAAGMGLDKPAIPVEVYGFLSRCAFPGNVRELRGMVCDAMAQDARQGLTLDTFKAVHGRHGAHGVGGEGAEEGDTPFRGWLCGRTGFPTLKEVEETLILTALQETDGNMRAAAALLGISRQALHQRLKLRPELFPERN